MTRPPTRRAVTTGAVATTLMLPTVAAGQTGRPTVLMIATSVGAMPDGRPTGLWLSELTTPYWTFLDAVFLCGGHGTMWDFRGSNILRRLVEAQDRRGAVVAALCHGLAGLLDARHAGGTPILAGRAATGFTNAEEDAVDLTAAMPYILETEMREQNARFTSADPFEPHAVRAGNLVTGQNPASAAATADAVLAALTHGHSALR